MSQRMHRINVTGTNKNKDCVMDLTILEATGITVSEFAKMLGSSRAAVYNWTKGIGPGFKFKAKANKLLEALHKAKVAEDLPLPFNTPQEDRLRLTVSIIKNHLSALA